MPIIVMWIDCSSGVSHSGDWIATLKGVACKPLRELEHARYRLVRAGGLLLRC